MRKLSGYGPSLIVLGTAMLVLFAGPSAVRALTYEQTSARRIQHVNRLEQNSILEQLNQAYRDVAGYVEPSVVHISSQHVRDLGGQRRTAQSSGSGWIYDEQGHIVTNYHVVEDASRIEVQLYDGDLREAEVVGYDKLTDIAVIRVEPGRLHAAERADLAHEVSQGDMVFAFGSPFNFRFSMSQGIVSGLGRSVGVIRDDAGRFSGYEDFIQVDAAINPGNSGGPLTDYRGRVIGMNTAIATGNRSGADYEEGQFAGIGLAIPLDMIEPVVSQLIEKGVVAKGYLGVQLEQLDGPHLRRLQSIGSFPTPDALRDLGFGGRGVMIGEVVASSPADIAGFQERDIVTEVNGKSVESLSQLRAMISSLLPGQRVEIAAWRYDPTIEDGEELLLGVELGRLPVLQMTGSLPIDQDRQAILELGIEQMSTSTPGKASDFDAEFHPGVLIQRMAPQSRLARQIPAGTTIVEVMGEPVGNVEAFLDRLGEFNLFQAVRALAITPDGDRRQILLSILR